MLPDTEGNEFYLHRAAGHYFPKAFQLCTAVWLCGVPACTGLAVLTSLPRGRFVTVSSLRAPFLRPGSLNSPPPSPPTRQSVGADTFLLPVHFCLAVSPYESVSHQSFLSVSLKPECAGDRETQWVPFKGFSQLFEFCHSELQRRKLGTDMTGWHRQGPLLLHLHL